MITTAAYALVCFIGILAVGSAFIRWILPKEDYQHEDIQARILLSSRDTKEIEKFLLAKEPYITKQRIDQLISHIEEIKADEVIEEEWQKRAGQ